MPKERTHWLAALKTREALPEGPLKELLTREEGAYLFGSVAPDSVFMPLDIPDEMEREWFHGHGNKNTFSFWQKAHKAGWLEQDWRRAYFFGITSHILTDASYHPLVYYYCGWPEHENKAIARKSMRLHYRLETLLDLYYMKQEQFGLDSVFLDDLIETLDLSGLAEMGCSIFFSNPNNYLMEMQTLIERHGKYQRLFSKPSMVLLSWFLKVTGITIKGKRDLIYRSPLRSFRHKELNYKNAATGEDIQTDWMLKLKQTALWEAEKLQHIQQLIETEKLGNIETGPHLETGIPANISSALQFSTPCNPDRLF